ncbi:MAG: hypothetical protein H7301_09145 [Cryobacterium sp.]|nr:hypothetical protein [Oligoflexia bacterium]
MPRRLATLPHAFVSLLLAQVANCTTAFSQQISIDTCAEILRYISLSPSPLMIRYAESGFKYSVFFEEELNPPRLTPEEAKSRLKLALAEENRFRKSRGEAALSIESSSLSEYDPLANSPVEIRLKPLESRSSGKRRHSGDNHNPVFVLSGNKIQAGSIDQPNELDPQIYFFDPQGKISRIVKRSPFYLFRVTEGVVSVFLIKENKGPEASQTFTVISKEAVTDRLRNGQIVIEIPSQLLREFANYGTLTASLRDAAAVEDDFIPGKFEISFEPSVMKQVMSFQIKESRNE